jgi:ABC-2 type transport system ATP-binding protein
MLTLKDFSKRYYDQLIIEVKHLSLAPGLYWIRGENGSGKSTLFKSIAGLIPFHGDILYNNISLLSKGVEYRKHVNYSEAEPLYPGFLTPKDLSRFVGKAKGADQRQQEYYIRTFGIDSYLENPCETCSSGMLKKISLALAFLGDPGVLILDEPLITLDVDARDTLLNEVASLLAKGKIFLVSSHQMIESSSVTIKNSFRIENKTLVSESNDYHT